jgi:hypothetical protein
MQSQGRGQAVTTRREIIAGLSIATTTLLTSCGTIIYPDRVNQESRGSLDPAIIILDGIGLFFFLVPGVIAFAVDFATGAIFIPEGKEPGDKERTIFNDLSVIHSEGKLNQWDVEHIVSGYAGVDIDLTHDDIQVVQLDHLNQFWMAHSQFTRKTSPA